MVAVVGLVRFSPTPGDFAANQGAILDQARSAAQLGAAVIVFPLAALSGVLPGQAPAPTELGGVLRRTDEALTELARAADKAALGGRYLLVGTVGWMAGEAPQLDTALIHQAKVGLRYAAGRPDPLATPEAGEHRVDGVLALRGPTRAWPVFGAHGVRLGIALAGSGAPARWPNHQTAIDAVLVQDVGGAWVSDRAGRRLSRDQPSHEGLSLWHTTD
ncbi:MAG: hypothetical protein LBD90_00370 [Bifidobacteriaceae bacterium]|jgi:hypothetical protein|nr:hypothetical protein [Bifidobacteriaceae bacterium]